MNTAMVASSRVGAPKLDIEKISDGPITCLRVNGAITETLDGKKLAAGIKAEQLVVDFSGVTHVSSFGIREWVAFNRAIEKNVDKVYIIGCSPAVMHELQVVTDFAGKGLVFSFYAPYACEHCDTSRQVLLNIDRDADAVKNMRAPDLHCEVCGQPEVFDEDPVSFFAFVSQQRKFEIDPAVISFLVAKIGYPATDLALRVQADKFVESRYVYLRIVGNLSDQFTPERLGEGLEGTVIIDVTGLGGSDEAGIAQFRKLLSLASLRSERLFIVGCQAGFMEGIPHEDPKLQVLSIALPYKCSSCAIAGFEMVNIDQHHHVLKLGMPPKLTCKSCGQSTSSIAGGNVLSKLSVLKKPDVEGKLKKFIERAQKRKPQVDKHKVKDEEVRATTSRASPVLMGGMLAIAAGLFGLIYWQQKESVERVEKTVEKLQAPTTAARPSWITSDLPASSYCTPLATQTTCVGVSSYVKKEDDGRTEAWNAALDALVHTIGLRIDDPAFAKLVRKRYSEPRQAALGSLQLGAEGAANPSLERVRNARKSVAKAFERSAGDAAPAQMSDRYWEKYEAQGGGFDYLVFVRVDVSAQAMDALVARYSRAIEVAGVKAVTTFPALAWRTQGEWDGVSVLEVTKGPLAEVGVQEGDVIIAIGDRAVRDTDDFAEILAAQPKDLKLRVARGDDQVLALSGK